MRTRIKTESTLVYSGKRLEVKKSTTETLISRWYEMSEKQTHKEKLADALMMYKEFQLKTAIQAVERGIYV